jgi:hypothetical protein
MESSNPFRYQIILRRMVAIIRSEEATAQRRDANARRVSPHTRDERDIAEVIE